MYYITGDVHGNFRDLKYRCEKYNLSQDDTLIILGDLCANYFLDERDDAFKTELQSLGLTLFCVHGNHEERPENIEGYRQLKWNGGWVLYEEAYPNLLFAIDGEVYHINGKTVVTCGGAYSVDKYYRTVNAIRRGSVPRDDREIAIEKDLLNLVNGKIVEIDKKARVDAFIESIPDCEKVVHWFRSEQPDAEIRNRVIDTLARKRWSIDVLLTHTAPLPYEPTEVFLPNVNQLSVDKSTEKFFGQLMKTIQFKHWYAGHYHINKIVNAKFAFLYDQIIPFPS